MKLGPLKVAWSKTTRTPAQTRCSRCQKPRRRLNRYLHCARCAKALRQNQGLVSALRKGKKK